ncbi:MAG: sodium:proton antiporter [Proteobacteria bacterium]|nr:sodium:proton antiporter [Pseudomonadota bacterium]
MGIACQWLAWRARLPAILLLLLCGMIIGPVTGLLNPDDLFADLLFPMISLSVAVILFEGSLTLKLDEIRGLASVVRNLITVGVLITWLITAVATHYLMGFPYELAFLFGAVVVVTGPTVIVPILRTVRPNAKIANILRWEGIVIDPLGALLAVLVFDFIISSQSGNALETVSLVFGRIVLVGTTLGALAAFFLGHILRRNLIPEYLRNVLSLTLVFAVYAGADYLARESGLLSVTVMGMVLANLKNTDIDDILDFKESLSILLISGLFIILAARIEFYQFRELGWHALGVLATIMLLARPIAVWVSSFTSDLKPREKLLIAWIGPRGIVAAAVASLFAIRLEAEGYPGASLLVPLTFFIIIGTVIIQSVTAKTIAHWLGVREPPATGLLIVGSGNVARIIGKALQESGLKVILTDSNWENISQARMEGLNTYFGNPASEHADRNLDLTGIGKMLAMTGNTNQNSLASLRFKSEFGVQKIFQLKTNKEQIISEKHTLSTRHRGNRLFGEDITYGQMASLLRQGAEIKSTQLSDEYDYEAYIANRTEQLIPLFAIDLRNRLHIFTAEQSITPESGWSIMSLIMGSQSEQ